MHPERGIIASLHALGATVDQLRACIASLPNRGALAQRDASPYAATPCEGWLCSHWEEDRAAFELHARDFGWLHEVAASLAQRGHEVLVVDGRSFLSDEGFRAFTVHAPGAAPKTWWIDPLRGLNSSEDELDDLLLKFKGEGHIAKDEVVERVRMGRMELLVRLVKNGQPLWPPEFLTLAQHQAEEDAAYRAQPTELVLDDQPAVVRQEPPAVQVREEAPPPQRTIGGLVVLVLLAPAAIAAPWFWASLGHVVDLPGALIASAFSVVSVGWLGLIPSTWVPLRFRLAWFFGVSALVPLLWVLT
ncbi:MAG: hypothetical protein JNM17_13085 [Archangium sp.]|nr:hypothetical protein [Archangium sp.]